MIPLAFAVSENGERAEAQQDEEPRVRLLRAPQLHVQRRVVATHVERVVEEARRVREVRRHVAGGRHRARSVAVVRDRDGDRLAGVGHRDETAVRVVELDREKAGAVGDLVLATQVLKGVGRRRLRLANQTQASPRRQLQGIVQSHAASGYCPITHSSRVLYTDHAELLTYPSINTTDL